MFTNRAKLMYYVQLCKEKAAFAKSERAKLAYREALKKLEEYIPKE